MTRPDTDDLFALIRAADRWIKLDGWLKDKDMTAMRDHLRLAQEHAKTLLGRKLVERMLETADDDGRSA